MARLLIIIIITSFLFGCRGEQVNQNSKPTEWDNPYLKPEYQIQYPFRTDSDYYPIKHGDRSSITVEDSIYQKRLVGYFKKNKLLKAFEISDQFLNKPEIFYYGYFNKNENNYLLFTIYNKKSEAELLMLCFDKNDSIKSHLRIAWNTYDAWSENIITYFNSTNDFIQKHYVTDLYHSITDTTYNSNITVTNYEFKGTDIIKKDSYQYSKKVGIGSGKTSMIEYEN